jgi:hypothetical protein
MRLFSNDIQVGDTVVCIGMGYPHWEGEIFKCDVIFNDNTIGLDNKIRVFSDDFRKIE